MDVDAWRLTHGFWDGLIHCIFLLPAASVHNLVPDFMHIVDIGLALHALGNTIFELVFERKYFPGMATNADRKDELWRRISTQYQRRGTTVQLSNLPFSLFCDEQRPHQAYPVLSTRCKAAETRCNNKVYRSHVK